MAGGHRRCVLRGDDDIHPIDAGPPDAAVAACTPSAWALETVAQWTDDTAPLAPQLRVADGGLIEIDYPTSPQAGWGGPRRAARRALDGAWTITETPSVGRTARSISRVSTTATRLVYGRSCPDVPHSVAPIAE